MSMEKLDILSTSIYTINEYVHMIPALNMTFAAYARLSWYIHRAHTHTLLCIGLSNSLPNKSWMAPGRAASRLLPTGQIAASGHCRGGEAARNCKRVSCEKFIRETVAMLVWMICGLAFWEISFYLSTGLYTSQVCTMIGNYRQWVQVALDLTPLKSKPMTAVGYWIPG